MVVPLMGRAQYQHGIFPDILNRSNAPVVVFEVIGIKVRIQKHRFFLLRLFHFRGRMIHRIGKPPSESGHIPQSRHDSHLIEADAITVIQKKTQRMDRISAWLFVVRHIARHRVKNAQDTIHWT